MSSLILYLSLAHIGLKKSSLNIITYSFNNNEKNLLILYIIFTTESNQSQMIYICGVPPLFIDKANQGPKFVDNH